MNSALQLQINRLPAHMREGITAYLEQHRPPGGFLRAVLENNLYEAVLRADNVNRRHIVQYAVLLEMLPLNTWGSPETVSEWLAQRSRTIPTGESHE